MREVHTETRSSSTELTAEHSRPQLRTADLAVIEAPVYHAPAPDTEADWWARVAELLCSADPAGRRDPERVAEILRLRHEQNWSHARIAEHVQITKSTVTRTLTAAQEHLQEGAHPGPAWSRSGCPGTPTPSLR
ncbi:sigma factor-like helix-turn-helix DNA-binding protein [Nocardia farcinica]|uniref:sigma factor-like helix-turn-helix DNA-binding protein n=1 Tax=Nocardia farcinica TaxID=37329 RepID=UPI0037A1E225